MIDRTLCRYTPPRGGQWLTAVGAILLTVGLAAWAGLPGTGLWMLARVGALLPAAVGLCLCMRWLVRVYTYSLEQQESGDVDLVVTEQNGLRCGTVCRIALDSVTDFTYRTRGKPRLPRKTYRYLNAPRPQSAVVLTCADPDGVLHLCITPSPEMLHLLNLLIHAEKRQDFLNEFGKTP